MTKLFGRALAGLLTLAARALALALSLVAASTGKNASTRGKNGPSLRIDICFAR